MEKVSLPDTQEAVKLLQTINSPAFTRQYNQFEGRKILLAVVPAGWTAELVVKHYNNAISFRRHSNS